MSEKFHKRISDPAYKPAQLAAGRSTICTCSFAACIFDGIFFGPLNSAFRSNRIY